MTAKAKSKSARRGLMSGLLLLLSLRLTESVFAQGPPPGAQSIFTDAAGAPTYQQLKSFGQPPSGASPLAGLIQGTDGALYGTATFGGSTGYGTVFKLNPDGTGFALLKSFDNSTNGGYPYAGLIQGTGGVLYGTTQSGGNNGYGTVFKLNPDGTGFTVLVNFDFSTTGGEPSAALIQGTGGVLYGTTQSGGNNGYGTVFKLNPDGTGFTVLQNFDYYTTGGYLYAGLIQGSDGALYGTANRGGSSHGGTVFKLNPDGTGFTVFQNFDYDTTGGSVAGGLLLGTDGVLYGTTQSGGNNGYGTVFKLNPDGSGFTVLQNFDQNTTGSFVYSGLIQGLDGALYGTANHGGSSAGTVFKLNSDGSGFTVLLNFDNYWVTGIFPYSGVIEGTDGALYGTTQYGGSKGTGTIFKLNPDGSGFTVLKNLSSGTADISESGGNPYAKLMQGADGALYGSANQGGSSFGGTVFKLNLDGSGFSILKNLDFSSGSYPNAGLMQGTDGALYGTASYGGSGVYGTVFKLNPDRNGFTVLENFDGWGIPNAALMQGTDGALYGTTMGTANQSYIPDYGTAFKLNLDGSGFTVLENFNINTTGGFLFSELVQGTNGALFGTTAQGGSGGYGTVFKLDPDGTGFTVLLNFDNSTTGGNPTAGLVQGADGALYGTATSGGSGGSGTVFKLNPDGNGFTVLKNFDYFTTGGYLKGGLVQREDGTIYGTAARGGSGGFGTVFQLNPDGTDFTVLLNFDNSTTGGYPYAGLMQGTDGNLYGTTHQGGDANVGTVFRLVFGDVAPDNSPPEARCKSITVSASANCSAAASIDIGSSDPDTGDTITITQVPPGPYALGDTLVMLTVTDNHGASSTCTATVTVSDNTPPINTCPANLSTGCSLDRLATVSYPAPTVFDNCDAHPTVTCTPASGSASFGVGVTTVVCKAVDAAGNSNTCSFVVTRAALGFAGFLPPIGGEVGKGTGGSFADPLRAFKFGSTIPVKFQAACGGDSVATGVHTIQAVKYSNSVDSDPAINATPTDGAMTGNQFRLTDAASGEWHFNLDTKPLSVGTWKLTATLSDGSFHEVWITIKK